MLGINLNKQKDIRILCLGAHCDDIEIGCGGTILTLLEKYAHAEVHWVVFSSDSRREKEARSSAGKFLGKAWRSRIKIEKFRNGFFPYIGGDIKEYFEKLKNRFIPDFIFTHYCKDLHQDHRIISELTWNTFRNHLILEYEIPKFDADLGTPNLYFSLEYPVCKYKNRTILSEFRTQGDKHWLTEDLLLSLLRIRGMECVSPTKYAEAFHCRKMVLE
jgi:LmbE family N-acetylglucosaminyl deacetylase